MSFTTPWSGIVVITESWNPGWVASLNGGAAKIFVADHALMGVLVPAGSHQLTMTYRVPGWRSSWLLACVGVAVLALAWRRGSSETPSS